MDQLNTKSTKIGIRQILMKPQYARRDYLNFDEKNHAKKIFFVFAYLGNPCLIHACSHLFVLDIKEPYIVFKSNWIILQNW